MSSTYFKWYVDWVQVDAREGDRLRAARRDAVAHHNRVHAMSADAKQSEHGVSVYSERDLSQ